MPIILAAIAILLLLALFAIALPLVTLMQRYRAGTARRRTRGWVAGINIGAIAISATLFLTISVMSSFWIPGAFYYTLTGICVGLLLGIVGLLVTRWERNGGMVYYTPSRLLVLAITLGVAARIGYGFWRGWHAWQLSSGETSWIAESGAAGSMGAGATVIGYYLMYWVGILRAHHRRS
jgi:hypothetical protein